jgi:phosphopantothenoylcysteine synthetase/decarboxylase
MALIAFWDIECFIFSFSRIRENNWLHLLAMLEATITAGSDNDDDDDDDDEDDDDEEEEEEKSEEESIACINHK